MNCKSCGAELPDDATFCGYCGAKVREDSKRDDVYQEVPPEYSEYREAAPVRQDPSYAGGRPNGNFTLYLVLAIVSTLLCGCTCFSLIPGVLSIIFAAQINGNNKMGNYEEADKAAKRALICIIITVAVGILTIVIGLLSGGVGILENVTNDIENYEYYGYY